MLNIKVEGRVLSYMDEWTTVRALCRLTHMTHATVMRTINNLLFLSKVEKYMDEYGVILYRRLRANG